MTHAKALTLVILAGIASAANALVIDDFTVAASQSIQSGTFVSSQIGAPTSIIGGTRDIEMAVIANPLGQYLDLNVYGSGMTIVSNGFMTQGVVKLQYDGLLLPPADSGVGKTLSNVGSGSPLIGATGADRVRVNFLGNDLQVDVLVTASLSGSLLASSLASRPAGSGAGYVDFMLGSAAMAQADMIRVEFAPMPSGDFGISKIESVPEPASMLALGLGLAGAVARRRSRRS